VDLDGDGIRDILSGSYSRMEQPMAGLFQVLWGQPGGTFKKAAVLNGDDGKPLFIAADGDNWIKNICTRPFAVDWDGDGHLDIVTGNFAGTFFVFKGKGKGTLAPTPEEIKVGGEPLKIDGHHSDPFVIDWDGDGDLDLLSGSSQGGVQWAENHAGPGKPPKLESFRTLIKPGPQQQYGNLLREQDLKEPSSDTRIWVDDFNSDGKLDILVGDNVTLISPADNVSEAAFKAKFAEWNKSINDAATKLNSAGSDAAKQNEGQQRYQRLYEQRNAFMKEDRTGYIWVYLQK
jgi:FG-GAP-like repeat